MSQILVTFEIFHITPWLVKVCFLGVSYFWDFGGIICTSKALTLKLEFRNIFQVWLKKWICNLLTKTSFLKNRKRHHYFTTPWRHNLKRNTKISISIPGHEFRFDFKFIHNTLCLVKVLFLTLWDFEESLFTSKSLILKF